MSWAFSSETAKMKIMPKHVYTNEHTSLQAMSVGRGTSITQHL